MRLWLRGQLEGWIKIHIEEGVDNLKRTDIQKAIAPRVKEQVKRIRGAASLLRAAAELSFRIDEEENSVVLLGTLYAGLAPEVYKLCEGDEVPSDTRTVRP